MKTCEQCGGLGRRLYAGKDGVTLDRGPLFPNGACAKCDGTGVITELPFQDMARRQVRSLINRQATSAPDRTPAEVWAELLADAMRAAWNVGFKSGRRFGRG